MRRLQHPSTVGIPMNHTFSLPHFFSLLRPAFVRECALLLLLILSLSRIIVVLLTRHTLDTADLLPSSLSHTFFDQALSVVFLISAQYSMYTQCSSLFWSVCDDTPQHIINILNHCNCKYKRKHTIYSKLVPRL